MSPFESVVINIEDGPICESLRPPSPKRILLINSFTKRSLSFLAMLQLFMVKDIKYYGIPRIGVVY